jgi:hypothetical protein
MNGGFQGMQQQLAGILLLIAALGMPSAALATDNRACKLLTAAELESVVGGKLSAFQGSTYGTGDMCTASSTTVTVMLRLAEKEQADAAAKSVDMLRKMGARVDFKTFGLITCSTVTPSRHMQNYGFKTACSVSKAAEIAAVEVRVKNQKDMVSIKELHLLADIMAVRF